MVLPQGPKRFETAQTPKYSGYQVNFIFLLFILSKTHIHYFGH